MKRLFLLITEDMLDKLFSLEALALCDTEYYFAVCRCSEVCHHELQLTL